MNHNQKKSYEEKQIPMHWHHFKWTPKRDNFQIVIAALIAPCSTIESRINSPKKNEEAQKFSARKNSIAINDRHAKLPLVEQTAASTTIKQAIKRKKNGEKRRTASNWNERLFHLWRTKDYAIEGDKPHLIGSDLNKSKLIAASPFHISFCCWCSSNVEIPSVARKNRHCSTHSLA